MPDRSTWTRRAACTFRRAKAHFLTHRTPVLTPLFFAMLAFLDRKMTTRRLTEAERLNNVLWKQRYYEICWRPKTLRAYVRTEHPVAYESDDHRFPRGTVFDNSTNPRFNNRVYELFGYEWPLRILDLGCAGGGLVRSFLEDGNFAIGLEGSDASRRHRSGEWDTIACHLFTCDVTKPFSIVDREGTALAFDLITSWEMFEHLTEEGVGRVIDKVWSLLRPGGYFIGSIDLLPDGNPRTGAIYHRTVQPADWWLDQFRAGRFDTAASHKFVAEDMVRGHGRSLKDWHPGDGTGLHIVARRPLDETH